MLGVWGVTIVDVKVDGEGEARLRVHWRVFYAMFSVMGEGGGLPCP